MPHLFAGSGMQAFCRLRRMASATLDSFICDVALELLPA
jgi:hypothetical protein